MKRFFLIIMLVCLNSVPGLVQGKQLPLWEAGIGGTTLIMPDYRGSDEYRSYLLPFPFLVYRGDILKIDQEQISGRLFKTKRLQLDMSFNGSVPVNSSQNNARKGMPDLNPTFEFGPSLQVLLDEDKAAGYKITLTFPVRTVLSTDFKSLSHAGWTFSPRLNLDQFNIGGKGLDLGFSLGPMFADQVYHNYYYQVDSAYATPQRPAYSTQGGYSGMQCTISLGKYFKNIWVGLFIKAENLQGTAFSESPLLKASTSFMGGLYFSWIFMKSKTLVEAEK